MFQAWLWLTTLISFGQLKAEKSIFPSGVGGDQNKAKRRVDFGLPFIMWAKKRLLMTANVAPCLLDVYVLNLYSCNCVVSH